MTEAPDFLLKNPETARPPIGRRDIAKGIARGIAKRQEGGRKQTAPEDPYSAYIEPVRHWLGDRPTNFLNARLNAASDS
jgi:hypothetical protein